MAINFGQLNFDPTQIWFGNNPLREVWAGDEKVWPSGPQSDAKFWLDFNDANAPLKDKGTSGATFAVSGTYPYHDIDHEAFLGTSRLNTMPETNWRDGFTVSMWTRDTPASSGWKTIMHRAVASGTLTNEAYIVHNTSATTTTIVTGLKFGSVHKEFFSNYALPVSSNWFHTVVAWKRLTATSYNCTIYINGVQRGSFNATGYPSNAVFAFEELYIGGTRTGGEWFGRMDDLLVWDRGLSAAEVAELYNQGRSWLPQILTEGPLYFMVGEAGGMQLTTNFQTTSWSATGLPDGITLSQTGYLSGSATTEGSGTATIVANGANDQTAEKTYPWVVEALVSLSVDFVDDAELFAKFPHRGFDSRTSSSSPRNRGWVWNGMLVAGDNSAVTYWNVLAQRPIKGDAEWVLRTGDVVSSTDKLGLIISSSLDFTYQIILEITDDNIRLVRRTTGGVYSLRSYNTRDAGPGSDVRVVRTGTTVDVYASGDHKFTYDLSGYPYWNQSDNGYFGINMYSTSGRWCGRVDSFKANETA